MKHFEVTDRFRGKVALITGAGSGIGRATALRLAREGAAVALADINAAGLAETARALPDAAPSYSITLDVADREACIAAVAEVLATSGKLDVLCNIAGIAPNCHFAELSAETWHRVIAINLHGVFYLCQAALPHLLASKGTIVNMSSSAGRVGQAYNSAYCAAKAGVLLLSKSLAVEFAAQGLRVNAVCPGAVATPLTQNFSAPDRANMALYERLSPLLPYMAEPEEIAAAVAYLASDEARFVTGAEFAIDGGQTAG